MSAFGGLIQTNKGRNLQAKAQTGVQLNFTRIAIGDGDLGGTSIKDLNTLINEKMSLEITKLKVYSTNGQALVGTVLSNQDVTTGFYFREIGVFANDPDEGEILYCYGNSAENAEYIPAGGGPDIIEKTIDIFTIIGDVSNVTATINQSLVYETPDGAQDKADQAEANANTYTDQQLAAHSADTASKFTNINLNIIDMAVELEALKDATLNGVTANIFIETFQNLDDINLMNGIYDSTNKRLVL